MEFLSFSSLLVVALLLWQQSNGCDACWIEEKAALLDIKATLCVPGTTRPLNWDTRDDCCGWHEVTCDSVSRRVTTLDLSRTCSFTGNTTPQLVNSTLFLPFNDLNSLSLAYNNFNGCIPGYDFGSLSILSKLEVLDLSGNNFNDSIIGSLMRVSSLRTLLISQNYLSDILQIRQLTALNLEVLELSRNSLSGAISVLRGWPFLKALSLKGNLLNGNLSIEEWCKMGELQELDLSQNKFTGELPSCIGNLTSLTYLDLSYNNLVIKFPTTVFTNLTSLKYVSLSGNKLEGVLFLSSFSNHSKLKILELSSQSDNFQVEIEFPNANPSFQLEGLELQRCNLNNSILSSILLNQHELYYLDLSHNQLRGFFPIWLVQNNSKLWNLNVRNNSFTGPLLMPSESNFNLSWLDVSQNKLSGELPSKIHTQIPYLSLLNLSRNSFEGAFPLGFSFMQFIFVLDISYNNISDHIENALQRNLTHLHSLYLSNNSFFGSFPNLVKVPLMIDLVLDGNSITGEIPESICYNTLLTYIDLSNNKLNGSLPSCLNQIRELQILNLGGNSLVGTLPISMCNMQHLQFVDLSRNNFSGILPSCLNMSNLQFLHLSRNSFTGTFPIALSNSPNLGTIDMSGNKFSGAIPRLEKGKFVKLRVLLLKGNRFEGSIPNQICNLKNLLILDLSHNSLSGQIPSCLSSVGSEGVLYSFQYENKYGSGMELIMPHYEHPLAYYPKTYASGSTGVDEEEFMTKNRSDYYKGDVLNYLSGIDLSCNKLNGYIPKELGSMNWILALNLSNNELIGTIPESLSNLTALESLDLSHNSLTGQIPRELAKLNYLESFSVAYNNLTGPTLGREGQYSTFGSSSYEGNPGLCGPPITASCTRTPPTLATEDNMMDREDQVDGLILIGSIVLSFVVGFWGSIAALYFKRSWRHTFFMVVDKYTELLLVKVALLLGVARSND